MAKVTVRNTQTHQIVINHKTQQFMVPASGFAMVEKEGKKERMAVPGEVELDEDMIAAARKASDVVEHFFTSGWLKIMNASPKK